MATRNDPLTDEELALNTQSGDTRSFGELVERYETKLLRYGKRFLRDNDAISDVVQEVFIKAYENIKSFDAGRKFSSWLYRIAHNEFINEIKRKNREALPFFDPDTIFPHPLAKENPRKEMEDSEIKEILNKCLDKLDLRYREPLILYYFEKMDYGEISDIMRIPTSTVGVRLKRGRTLLKNICGEMK